MRGFSFWPSPDKREGKNIYDVRSYQLKPGNDYERGGANTVRRWNFDRMKQLICMFNIYLGSMYDWSNYWARGIRCRQSVRSNIPYAGFFCQLGQLHTIYHIW